MGKFLPKLTIDDRHGMRVMERSRSQAESCLPGLPSAALWQKVSNFRHSSRAGSKVVVAPNPNQRCSPCSLKHLYPEAVPPIHLFDLKETIQTEPQFQTMNARGPPIPCDRLARLQDPVMLLLMEGRNFFLRFGDKVELIPCQGRWKTPLCVSEISLSLEDCAAHKNSGVDDPALQKNS